jgi:hypothetical protein
VLTPKTLHTSNFSVKLLEVPEVSASTPSFGESFSVAADKLLSLLYTVCTVIAMDHMN